MIGGVIAAPSSPFWRSSGWRPPPSALPASPTGCADPGPPQRLADARAREGRRSASIRSAVGSARRNNLRALLAATAARRGSLRARLPCRPLSVETSTVSASRSAVSVRSPALGFGSTERSGRQVGFPLTFTSTRPWLHFFARLLAVAAPLTEVANVMASAAVSSATKPSTGLAGGRAIALPTVHPWAQAPAPALKAT